MLHSVITEQCKIRVQDMSEDVIIEDTRADTRTITSKNGTQRCD